MKFWGKVIGTYFFMSNNDQEYEGSMDDFYDDIQRANEIKFGTYHGNQLLDAAKKGDINAVKKILSLPLDRGGMLLLRLTAQDKNGNYAHHIAAADRRFHLGNSSPERIELIRLGWEKGMLI